MSTTSEASLNVPKGIAALKERRKLQLAPRTKPIEPVLLPGEATASSSIIFGGAKPVDTATREREIEERLAKEKESGVRDWVEESKRRKYSFNSELSNRSKLSSGSSPPGSLHHDDDSTHPYNTPIWRQKRENALPKVRQRCSSDSSSTGSDRHSLVNSKVSNPQRNRKGSYVDDEDEHLSSLNSANISLTITIGEVLQNFYENGLHTDISFRVRCGDGYISFSCHKLILSLWSPVFADMFFKKQSSEAIEITKVPPSAFEIIIKYCYGIERELQKYRSDVTFLLKVYKGATEYKIKGLQVLCCEVFSCALPTKDNVFQLLDAATLIDSESLTHRCYKVLQTQTREIIGSRELCELNGSVVNIILDMTALSLDSEFELIEWVFDWGYQESNRFKDITFRDVMAPFLPRLNFLSLKPEEFVKLVSKHKEFFDEKEGFAILMNAVCPESWPVPPWFGKKFNRCFPASGNTSIN